MGIVYVKSKFSDFSSENSLRSDFNYVNYIKKQDDDFYNYKELFSFVSNISIDLANLDSFQYAEIGDVSKNGDVCPQLIDFSERNEENEGLFKKIEKGDIIKPIKGDILISKIRPYLNKNVLIGEENIYFTKAFIHIRPKINSEILYFAIRSIFFEQINAVSRQGKGYPTIKEDDLKSIKFSKRIIDILILNEESILSKVNPLSNEISVLKKSVQKDTDIINLVLGKEFAFDWEEFARIKSEKLYYSNFSDYSNNIDCRFGFRFQHKSGEYMMNFLKGKTDKKIKDFIVSPIILGASISPSQFDENGEYYYISMATVKKYYFDKNDAQLVSSQYSSENLNKTVEINDIIMTRSGMAIGKFAMIDQDIKGIFADFTMRIRLRDFDQCLAYYYFRSDFFQHLITTHKKGLQNHNIFPSQIQEFPLPDWSITDQLRIKETIKSKIDASNLINEHIANKIQQISDIINKTILL